MKMRLSLMQSRCMVLTAAVILAIFLVACDRSEKQAPPPPTSEEIAQNLLKKLQMYSYGRFAEHLKADPKELAIISPAVVEILREKCEKEKEPKERLNAALVLAAIYGQVETPGIEGCMHGVLMTADLRDAAFWLQLNSQHAASAAGIFVYLFTPLAQAGQEKRAMEVLGRIVNELGDIEDPSRPTRKQLLFDLRRLIISNEMLLRDSVPLLVGSGCCSLEDLIRYYGVLLGNAKTPDEALAFYDFMAGTVFNAVASIPEYKREMVTSVREDSNSSYFYEYNGHLIDGLRYKLQPNDLPVLDKLQLNGTLNNSSQKIEGRYIIVHHNVRRPGQYYFDGGLTVLIPEQYRARSIQEADRMVYISTNYEHAFDFKGGAKAYTAVEHIYIVDIKTGKLINTLQNVANTPPTMITTTDPNLKEYYTHSNEHELGRNILLYLKQPVKRIKK